MNNVAQPGAAPHGHPDRRGLRGGVAGSATVAALMILVSAAMYAETSALEIMREVERRQRTQSQSNLGTIEVIDGRGKVLNKSWRFYREGSRGSSKMLVRFLDPPEVRGVGLLTLNYPNKPAEQWLYTPAIRRDRRVAPQEKSQRFMGTDFTHEDMEERAVDDYRYDLLGEETFAGQPSWKIRAVYGNQDNTQYSQLYLWVRKDIVVNTYVEFYIGGRLRKTLHWDDWRQVQGIWTPHLSEMKDLARGSTTRIRTSELRYNVAFEPDWFSLRNLRRVP